MTEAERDLFAALGLAIGCLAALFLLGMAV